MPRGPRRKKLTNIKFVYHAAGVLEWQGGPGGNILQISSLSITLRPFLNGTGAQGENLTNFKLVYRNGKGAQGENF